MTIDTADFVGNSIVDVLVPETSDIDIEEVLGSSTIEVDERSALITSIPQRSILFFDAHAISSNPRSSTGSEPQQGSSGNQSRDVIWSGAVNVTEEPVIVVQESEDDVEDRHVLILWKLKAFLSRPRIRLQAPAINFSISASIRAERETSEADATDPYLPSGITASVSALQLLQGSSTVGGIESQLSVPEIPRAIISAQSRSVANTLKVLTRAPFRTIPALSARVRYNRSTNDGGRPSVIVSLDIEIPSFVQNHVELVLAQLKLSNGEVEDLVTNHTVKLPLTCRSRDNVIFLYQVSPDAGFIEKKFIDTNTRAIDITIDATVLVSETCRPRIEMRWRTSVDFSTALNPSFGSAGSSMQRTNRPSSLPKQQQSDADLKQKNSRDSTSSNLASDSKAFSPEKLAVTVTFSAPTDSIYVGEPFRWSVFIVNRSRTPQRLAIFVIPKRRKGGASDERPPSKRSGSQRPLSSPMKASNGNDSIGNIAPAVIDEGASYRAAQNGTQESAKLICLSPDVRIGPLAPGSCFETEIKLLALSEGFLEIEAVRIVDMDSNEAVDVRELPDVAATKRDVDN